VEQQGELIRFLQRRCDNLAREVLHLQAREDRWATLCASVMISDCDAKRTVLAAHSWRLRLKRAP